MSAVPKVLIVDAVGHEHGWPASIGLCIANFLRLFPVDARVAEVLNINDVRGALAADAVRQTNPTHLLLVTHANREGFGLRSREFVDWGTFSAHLGAVLPSLNVLLLCGCEAGYEETARAILSVSPRLLAVWGPQSKPALHDAAFAYLSLYYHIAMKGQTKEQAIEAVNRDTGVGLCRWERA